MKTNLDRWIKKQEASCRRTTKGRWRLLSDAQGPCMVMHPAKGGVAIATLTLTHLPANGVHEPGARKPSPCPEAPGGTTYLPERVANARFIADAHDNMPVALRLIRAALAAGAGAAMQAALDGMLEEQALSGGLRAAPPAAGCRQYEGPRRARRSRTTMTPPLPPTTPTTRCSGARTGNRPKSNWARKKNVGLAAGEPEFAPCGDCGFVHNESFCPRCEGDGEEDLPGNSGAIRRASAG